MGLAVSFVLVIAAVTAVDLPLLRAGPLPEDCLAGTGGFWRMRLLAAAAAVAAGWGAALLSLVPGLRRRAGLYGQGAAALAAALLMTAIPQPLRQPGEAFSWPGWLAVALGAALISPLLRERGVGSLLWPPLFLGLLLVHGRRQNLYQAARTIPLAQVQSAIDIAGAQPFLSVPARMPLDLRRALVLGLREPFFDRDVNLVTVETGSPEERRLGELGLTGVGLDGDQITLTKSSLEPTELLPLDIEVSPAPAGAWSVLVLPASAEYDVSVVTPAGVVRRRQSIGSSLLDETGQQALRRLLAPPIPAGSPVLILAEAVGTGLRGWRWVISP